MNNGENNGGVAMKNAMLVLWCLLMVVLTGCPEDSSWGKGDQEGDVVRQLVCQSDDDCATGKCMDDGSCKDECISAFNCYELYGSGGLVCKNGRCESTAGQDANWVPNGGSSGGNNGGSNNGNDGEQPKPTECNAGESRFCGELNKGECHPGQQTCSSDGKWGSCEGAINPAVEICDNKDNDCDGYADENFNKSKDVDNCGQCGNKCAAQNASATCVAGKCEFACQPSFVDLNEFVSDGCEFQCLFTWGGIEKCDGLDNDCDGLVDEDFNLLTDAENCGQCGNKCSFDYATAVCFYGNCVAEKCDAGFVDANTDAADGCECELAGPEVCDGFADEDCDGKVDEGCPCVVGANCGSQVGECQTGVSFCLANGTKLCVGEVKPAPDVCDYADNDCDGQKDEDFDLSSDVDNCGFCGVVCSETNAVAACVDGECELASCNAGWYDLDSNAPGCEYPCWFVGEEKCNGIDDDCDGEADEDFNVFNDVNNCGQCGNKCVLFKAQAACFFGMCLVASCDAGFVDLDENPLNGCEYKCVPSGVELCDVAMVDDDCDGSFNEDCKCADGDTKAVGTDEGVCQKCVQTCVDGQWSDCVGGISPVPEICDYADNDCDAAVDEDFSLMSDPGNCGWCGHVCVFANADALCVGGLCKMGGCTGFFHDANADPSDGCEYACVSSGAEKCNGVDDDCDGKLDEDFDLLFNDLQNCGACGKICNLWQAANNVCFFGMCLVESCKDGYVDLDGQPENGCEYKCTATGAEGCDAAMADEDCDGSFNEDCKCADGDTKAVGTDEGVCQKCTQTCVDGQWSDCVGGISPVPEICDYVDNDCDASVDETFNTQTDPANCGWCGHACSFANAQAMCVDGECKLGACDKLFYDTNNNAADGCEYLCLPSGVEQCNGVDDDCDGLVDEDFNLFNDTQNCGKCGNACAFYSAVAGCNKGECVVAKCQPGFYDLDGISENGCEYKCSPSGVELCDVSMKDEDCDGSFNEDCKCVDGSLLLVGSDEGECEPCVQLCLGGEWTDCVGGKVAEPELCDSKDNDCDAAVDEDFNTQTDPANCGWCGNACSFAHVQALCGDGKCVMGQCDAMYYDINGKASDGCEYLCLSLGAEKCNGVDDDCDGLVDEDFNVQTDAQNCGQCGNICSLSGAVAGCAAGKCTVDFCLPNQYDLDGVEANGCEYVCVFAGPEDCDGQKDDDCDGSVDEGCACKNGTTKSGGTDEGLCKVCTQTCVAGKWSDCVGGVSPVPELCDAKDNDCDEEIDEDFNVQTDAQNCGQCGNVCSLKGAVAGCAKGKCVVDLCLPNQYDLDGVAANGCEYGPCVVQGAEQCDGFDNDCDGLVDEDFVFASDPAHCGNCQTNCNLLPHVATAGCTAGKCTVLSCDSSFYDLNKVVSDGCEYDCPFKIPAAKETCGDGLDNDCDGKVDNGCPLNLIACDFACPAGYVPVVWWGGVPGYSWEGATSSATWTASSPQICERGENPTIPAESGWVDFNCKNGNLYQWTPGVVASCYYTDGGALTYQVRAGVVDPGGEGEIVFVNVCL